MTKRFFKFIAAISVGYFVICSVLIINLIGSDDYFDLLVRMKEVESAKYSIKDITSVSSAETGTTDVTDGAGLNLMLIDSLTESYARDLLTCMRNSEQGKYDNYTLRLPVAASCGLQNAETGLYPGTSLLKSYLPFNDGKPVWNTTYKSASASEMTLEKYDKSVEQKAGHYSGVDSNGGKTVTVFQYDYWDSRQTVAKIDGAGNANRKKGDHYYYPDVLATNNKYITNFVTKGSSSGNSGLSFSNAEQNLFDSAWLSFMYATAHNRGESGSINYMFGAKMGAGSSKVLISKITDEQRLDITNSFVSLYSDYRKSYPNNYNVAELLSGSDTYNWVTGMLAVHSADWYISSATQDYLLNNVNTCVKYWNALYPEEKIDSDSLSSKIKAKTSTFSEAIKKATGTTVSVDDCIKVYGTGTDGDEYKLSGWPSWDGFVFKATDIKSNAYKNTYSDGSLPYVVHCMDLICAKEAISACFGDVVYAKTLYYAGLGNVDPTNPDTYYADEKDFVPSGDLSWLKLYGVDESSLSTNRKNLLATAYNLVNLESCTYAHIQAGEGGGPEVRTMKEEYYNHSKPTELDCSGFLCRAYRDSGFSGFSSYMSTAMLIKNNTILECISPSELQPGDILVRNDGRKGHTMIYLSGYDASTNKVKCTVMESNVMTNVTYNRDGPNIRTLSGTNEFASDTVPKTNGKYYCYRLKTLETDKTRVKTY